MEPAVSTQSLLTTQRPTMSFEPSPAPASEPSYDGNGTPFGPRTANPLHGVIEATRFAADRHSHQRRKYHAATPYINHRLTVASILKEAGMHGPELPVHFAPSFWSFGDTVEGPVSGRSWKPAARVDGADSPLSNPDFA